MDQNIDNKIKFKERLLNFYKINKVKVFILILILILLLISFIFIKYKKERDNILVAEKYIQAGIYLTANKKNNAKETYIEILLTKNKFYSILALNTIIEKNLISNKDEILEYFEILEKSNATKEQKNLIKFKKALYLIKNLDTKKGNNLLKELIDNDSSLKSIAEEIIKN
tara:strand:- start:2 stop:511 length:510 start_codon:yes stop_codon:yes gene_type:complete